MLFGQLKRLEHIEHDHDMSCNQLAHYAGPIICGSVKVDHIACDMSVNPFAVNLKHEQRVQARTPYAWSLRNAVCVNCDTSRTYSGQMFVLSIDARLQSSRTVVCVMLASRMRVPTASLSLTVECHSSLCLCTRSGFGRNSRVWCACGQI